MNNFFLYKIEFIKYIIIINKINNKLWTVKMYLIQKLIRIKITIKRI